MVYKNKRFRYFCDEKGAVETLQNERYHLLFLNDMVDRTKTGFKLVFRMA